ncbi:MAG: inositol monophosphatase family protein [Candidatus Promineifilaceae bacterium]|jgi:myo-inositol-1(or 4)-monophosphatase
MSHNLHDYLDFATAAADQAGKLTLGYFQTGVRPDFKADDTPVTIADRQAETMIRDRINAEFPDHAIIGEEYGDAQSEGASYRWFIDPIDGTKAFVRGVPLYAVLIGLEINGTIEVGVANFPAMGEMIAAASGLGCWWNGRPTSVSEVDRLENALVAHADAASFAKYERGEAWSRIKAATGFRAGWSDAYGYLLVATGRAEIMLDPIMNTWDCAPFPVILKEAGGYFGDWSGNSTIYAGEALGTNGALQHQVLDLVRSG